MNVQLKRWVKLLNHTIKGCSFVLSRALHNCWADHQYRRCLTLTIQSLFPLVQCVRVVRYEYTTQTTLSKQVFEQPACLDSGKPMQCRYLIGKKNRCFTNKPWMVVMAHVYERYVHGCSCTYFLCSFLSSGLNYWIKRCTILCPLTFLTFLL